MSWPQGQLVSDCTPIQGAYVRRPQKNYPLGLTDRTRPRRPDEAQPQTDRGTTTDEAARDALAVLITDYRAAAQAAISRPEARQPRSAQNDATPRPRAAAGRCGVTVALTLMVASDSADPP